MKKIRVYSSYKRCILALGGEMQSAFAVYSSGKIHLSSSFGNTHYLEHFEQYEKALRSFLTGFGKTPDLIVCDLHPDFQLTRLAEKLAMEFSVPLVRVQHHLAHAYGCALEHDLDDFASIVCDGMGHGEDGSVWGGEVFDGPHRIGHLEPHLLLGGDKATEHPLRMLYSILRKEHSYDDVVELLKKHEPHFDFPLLEKQLTQKYNSPLTTSCGRVFDAASVLLGFFSGNANENSPAVVLEQKSAKDDRNLNGVVFSPHIEDTVLLTSPLFSFLVKQLEEKDGAEVLPSLREQLGYLVQKYIAEGLYFIAKKSGKPIVFSGGCAHNLIMQNVLSKHGVYLHKQIPPGDEGLAYGQIAYVLANPRNDIP